MWYTIDALDIIIAIFNYWHFCNFWHFRHSCQFWQSWIDNFDHFYNFDNALGSQKILGSQNILGSQKPSCLRVFKKSPDSVNSFDNIYMFGPRPVVIFSCPSSSMPTLDSGKVKVFPCNINTFYSVWSNPFGESTTHSGNGKKSWKLQCPQVK